jgi:hypothetical protein
VTHPEIEEGSREVKQAKNADYDDCRHGVHWHVLKDGREPQEGAAYHESHQQVAQACG